MVVLSFLIVIAGMKWKGEGVLSWIGLSAARIPLIRRVPSGSDIFYQPPSVIDGKGARMVMFGGEGSKKSTLLQSSYVASLRMGGLCVGWRIGIGMEGLAFRGGSRKCS